LLISGAAIAALAALLAAHRRGLAEAASA